MVKKEINIISKQIEKLDVKDFDLEAWKKFTIVMLARIFGDTSDTSGTSSYLESCKKLGKKILEASIAELETFGLPDKSKEDDRFFRIIIDALQDELKGSQFRELKALILSMDKEEEMKEKVREILNDYDTGVPVDILTLILTNKVFKNELSK